MADAVLERLSSLVSEMAPVPGAEVGEASDLIDDLGFDSLTLIELTVAIETAFGLAPVAEFESTTARTVGDVASVVRRAIEAQR
jgi:acyl carrier protein